MIVLIFNYIKDSLGFKPAVLMEVISEEKLQAKK